MKLIAVAALCAVAACSGGSSNSPNNGTGPGGGGDETVATPDKAELCDNAMTAAMNANEAAWNEIVAKGTPETLEDLAAAACQRFCGRSTECAIEDACLNLDAAKVADLQFDRTAPENTRQCVERCNASRMTKQQIQILGNCAQDDDSTCDQFRTCSAEAQPK